MNRGGWSRTLAAPGQALRKLLGGERHPLQAYVRSDQGPLVWRAAGETPVPAPARAVRIHFLSQVWQGLPWKHELCIIRPERIRPGDAGLLLISGDRGDADLLRLAARAAAGLGRPVAVLSDVPNQPLFGGKREDALIAHTFEEYLRTRDRTWPLLFPMVKSAVRAMDMVQEFTKQAWGAPLSRFVVTGASKRGWTTWLTGATDPRVIGIAPMVYDNLNLPAQMRQQIACYGGYSEQIRDYDQADLPGMLATPEGRLLADLVDPFVLRRRLGVPKLLIHGSNDRYWTLESANLYYDALPGDKHVLYVPNCGHCLRDLPKVLQALGAFADACAEGRTLPRVYWRYDEGPGSLSLAVKPESEPLRVTAWTAAAESRDFREARWRPRRLCYAGGEYRCRILRPDRGYAAIFGEVTYQWPGGRYSQSTTPRIIGPAGSEGCETRCPEPSTDHPWRMRPSEGPSPHSRSGQQVSHP